MWEMAVYPTAYTLVRDAMDEDIHRREVTLRILYRLSSSEAMRAECICDVIEIRRMSENVCRRLILQLEGRDTLQDIEMNLLGAIMEIDYEHRKKKSIIDESRGAEEVFNAVWSKHRRRFRRLVRRLRVYFECVHVHLTFVRKLMFVQVYQHWRGSPLFVGSLVGAIFREMAASNF